MPLRLLPGRVTFARTRRRLARRYLHGTGIEVGALHMPQHVPRTVTVHYVDRTDLAGLLRHYPELADEALVAPDIVDDGETLDSLSDASQDFLIANHFIEHTEDPLGTLAAHARVLKPGGTLFMAFPDARRGIDAGRPRTTWEHVLRDHREGGAVSRAAHYHEWASLVDLPLGNIAPGEVDAHARGLEERSYSIHFHVWERDGFLELLERARAELGLPLRVLEAVENHHEVIVVAQREA